MDSTPQPATTPARAFEVDGQTYDLASMREANRDDPDLLDWLDAAQVGEWFPAMVVACRRVS